MAKQCVECGSSLPNPAGICDACGSRKLRITRTGSETLLRAISVIVAIAGLAALAWWYLIR